MFAFRLCPLSEGTPPSGPTPAEPAAPAAQENHQLDVETIAENSWKSLKDKFLTYLEPSCESRLHKAYRMAHALHADQRRKSGEPYIVHPLAVAEILTEFQMDETSLAAAILHDVVEDTHVSVEEVEAQFGPQVAALVDGLTKLAKVQFRSTQEKMAENFRKMVVAMSRDIRVIIIKLADRTHNLRTIKALSHEKRQRIAEETLEIYAPIAGRLGIYKIKAELEDMCLKELKPSVYFSLVARVSQKKTERELVIDRSRDQVVLKLKEFGIDATVTGRAKHFYSIYKKMTEKQMEFEDLYDLFALRIMVKNLGECYEALGVVHSLFKPVPGRFKDYIALPKANLYQSLHTTVLAARGELLEVQIRTWDMHDIAENGIAAHWVYKDKKTRPESPGMAQADLEKFNWLKQIVKHQKEISDPNEFLEAVKVDLFDDEVYVFSPKGDVYELRKGSTILDFAFAVHTELGLRCAGSKINGRLVPLRSVLHSGDVVEILTGNKVKASKDWLNMVITSRARNKIRGILRQEERDEARRHGLELLEVAIQKAGLVFEKLQKSGTFQDVNRTLHVSSFEELIMQIGYGKLDANTCVHKLTGINPLQPQAPEAAASPLAGLPSGFQATGAQSLAHKPRNKVRRGVEDCVIVQGMNDIVVRLAKCCEPLPGQPVVGFVSRARGVTVHSASCQWAMATDPARRVDCAWESGVTGVHHVRLRITTHDRPGMLAAVTKLVSTSQINITSAEAQTTPEKRGLIVLKLEVKDIMQLRDIHQKIEAIEGVVHVERQTGS